MILPWKHSCYLILAHARGCPHSLSATTPGVAGGRGWNLNIYFYLGPHAKFQNPRTIPFGRKLTRFHAGRVWLYAWGAQLYTRGAPLYAAGMGLYAELRRRVVIWRNDLSGHFVLHAKPKGSAHLRSDQFKKNKCYDDSKETEIEANCIKGGG